MKDSERTLLRLKNSLLDDKVVNSDSLLRLLASEIMSSIEDFVEVDRAYSSIELDFSGAEFVIRANIKVSQVKRLGAQII